MGCCSSNSRRLEKIISVNQNLSPFNPKLYPPENSTIRIQTDIKSNYTVVSTLGYGTYATVRKVQHKFLPKTFAVKSFAKERPDFSQIQLQREMMVLETLDHPHIIKLHQVYQDPHQIHFVMQSCEGGELFQRLAKKKTLSQIQAAKVMFQLLYAINHMHSKNIVHLDLKPQNVLHLTEDSNSNIKIIDFGLALSLDQSEHYSEPQGTPVYIAPEALDGQISLKSDVWSLGVIFYTLLAGYQPFSASQKMKLYNQIRSANYSLKDKVFNGVSSQAKDLIKSMMCKDLVRRFTAFECMEHPWFAINRPEPVMSINFDSLKQSQTNVIRKEIIRVLLMFFPQDQIQPYYQVFLNLDKWKTGKISLDNLLGSQIENQTINFTDFLVKFANFSQLATTDQAVAIIKYLNTSSEQTISQQNFIQGLSTKKNINVQKTGEFEISASELIQLVSGYNIQMEDTLEYYEQELSELANRLASRLQSVQSLNQRFEQAQKVNEALRKVLEKKDKQIQQELSDKAILTNRIQKLERQSSSNKWMDKIKGLFKFS